ncbi:hypothetical protein D9M68_621790 [compost metagenome]
MHYRTMRKLLPAALLALSLAAPLSAQAKGLLVFNTGDELFHVASLPQELSKHYPDSTTLGYKCKRFAIFWADAWTWDCKLAAVDVEDDSYGDLPNDVRAELEKKYTMSDSTRGFWNHYGIAAMLLGLIGIALLGGFFSKDK